MNYQAIVNEFSNCNNPTREQTANAYYARDRFMNISFERQFHDAMKKLGYDPSTYEPLFKEKVKKIVDDIINNFMNDPNANNAEGDIDLNNILRNVQAEIHPLINMKRVRYNYFLQFLNNNDHRGFYQAMEMNELICLGW